MKKLSKKKRAELKEKAVIREKVMAKAGEPYSRHKIRVCQHIDRYYFGCAYPTLIKISEDKCMCTICKTEFPIEFMDEMRELTRNYRHSDCVKVYVDGETLFDPFFQRCRLVSYYYVGPDEIRYVES